MRESWWSAGRKLCIKHPYRAESYPWMIINDLTLEREVRAIDGPYCPDHETTLKPLIYVN